jgi:hypothetical protein
VAAVTAQQPAAVGPQRPPSRDPQAAVRLARIVRAIEAFMAKQAKQERSS